MEKTEDKNKYFIYARKSSESEDKQVASIDAQVEELKRIANFNNLEIVNVFSEAQSAKAPGRPIFNEMIQRVYNQEAQGIICWKLDRLARNPVDGGTINWMLQQGAIKHIRSYEKSYYPTDNVLMMSVEFGMANQFVRDLSVNVKRGLRKKVNDGWLPGVAPSGYLNTPNLEKGYKIIIEDEERFPLVRRMWDLILSGNYTAPQIWKMTIEWGLTTVKRKSIGGKPLSRSAVYAIFTNPFYYGYFEYPRGSGVLIKGKHKPMITQEEFDRVQIILGRKGKPRPQKNNFAFTGLMRCQNCNSSITAENKTKRQKNGNIHNYVYYHCTKRKDENCTERSIEVKELNKQIKELLGTITISERFKDWAIKYLHELRKNEAETHETIFRNKQEKLRGVIENLDSLLIRYTSPENKDGGLISALEYQSLKSRLIKDKNALEGDLKKQGEEIEEWVELSEKTFNFACYAKIWFEKGDDKTKKTILSCLGSNLLVKDRKLNVDLHPYLKTIVINKEELDEKIDNVRTSKNGLNKRKNRAFDPVHPVGLRGQDSNLQPIRYTYPKIASRGGLYHHPKIRSEALPPLKN